MSFVERRKDTVRVDEHAILPIVTVESTAITRPEHFEQSSHFGLETAGMRLTFPLEVWHPTGDESGFAELYRHVLLLTPEQAAALVSTLESHLESITTGWTLERMTEELDGYVARGELTESATPGGRTYYVEPDLPKKQWSPGMALARRLDAADTTKEKNDV